jgi:hypothetical protein
MGDDYAFRYRAINAIGPGEWSDIVILKAAIFPAPPGKPYYIGSTADSITLGLPQTDDNGGSKIRAYELYRDDGDLSSDITTQVTDYNGVDQDYRVENLTPGIVYRFTTYALNDYGVSPASLILTIASSHLPDPPTDIVIDWPQSSKTSMMVQWQAPTVQPDSIITGYLLEMDQGNLGSIFELIYDGSEDNNNLYYLKQGLTNGLLYTFRVYALNFNGMSVASAEATYYACTAPAGFARAEIVEQTQNEIEISWVPPIDDGGCRIISYIIYRDDGLGSNIDTEVN